MTISSFEALDVRFDLSSDEEIANISTPRSQHFAISNFKGRGKKMSIFFI